MHGRPLTGHLAMIWVSFCLLFVVSSAAGRVAELGLFPDWDHAPFEFGVASGDPLPDSILIWTRAQRNGPSNTLFTVDQLLTWRLWNDNNASDEINGTVLAQADTDFTVTVPVSGLQPDTYYRYQFVHDASGNVSATGRTRTAPPTDSEQPIKIAAVSCSSIWSGYLNSYARIAEIEDLNVVVHVGDFIYPELDKSSCQRVPMGLDQACRNQCAGKELPQEQMTNISSLLLRHNCSAASVDQFRWVYQYYLHDPLLRELRRNQPMIVIFDNHDVGFSRSVNLTKDGGLQAFVEYIPVRAQVSVSDNSTIQFFRELRFGKMLDLIALDTRAIGVNISGDGSYLGQAQLQWLDPILRNATSAQWRIFLTTTAFAPWAVNGWDVYVNSIFAGTFVALVVLAGICICSTFYIRRRQRDRLKVMQNLEGVKTEDATEAQPIIHERKRRQLLLKCCSVYGVCSVGIIIIIWVTATVIVNRVIAARRLSVNTTGNSLALVAGEDRNWDGHPEDRRDFLQRLREVNLTSNNVWVSGDLHMSLASDVRDIDHTDSSSVYTAERFGVEMLSSSVSRANVDEILSSYIPQGLIPAAVNVVHTIMYRANPHFRYFEVTEHGYGVLHFSGGNVTGEYWHTPVQVLTSEQWLAKQLICIKNESQWHEFN